jgi:hypothetical protein
MLIVWIVSDSPITGTMCVKCVCVCVCVCVYIYKITVVLGLKSRVVTVGIRALGLDPEDN